MAIDSRQVKQVELDIKQFGLQADDIIYGNKANMNIYFDEDTSMYHVQLTLPNELDPEYKEPEQPPITEPTINEGNDIAPLETPIKKLHEYSVQEIVNQVRAGRAKDYWPVGSRIPIFVNSFNIGNRLLRDNKLYGNYPIVAVVIGHDHNLAKETPQVKHSMTFALMHRYNNADWWKTHEQAIIYMSNSEYASKVMAGTLANMESALPNDWNSCIIPTTKAGSVEVTEANPTGSTSKKMFFLSYYEVHGYDNYTQYMKEATWNNGAQEQYEYFKKYNFPSSVHYVRSGHNYVDTNVVVLSRSKYKDIAHTRIILNDRLANDDLHAMYILDKSPASTGYNKITYNETQFFNTLYTSTTPYGKGYNSQDDYYTNDKGIVADYVSNYGFWFKVKLPLNGVQLGINSVTTYWYNQLAKGSTNHILRNYAGRYLFGTSNGIPCFTIG